MVAQAVEKATAAGLKYTGEAMITRVKVSNFKSFDHLEVELRPLNIVVGSNAAGKSNFLEIFRFLRDVAVEGTENAVSLQGGMEFLKNLQIGSSQPISVDIVFDSERGPNQRVLIAETPLSVLVLGERPSSLGAMEIFDLDPKLPKKAAPITGRAYLEPDGSNLALVLRNLLQDPDGRMAFIRLLHDTLPFVEGLEVERFADKSLLIAAKESFSERTLPASFLSDGTIHLAALIIALYFHPASTVIIEEPERNIHPHLISKVVRMLADASRQKQVIVTTHNPELVKHADLADLLLVTRDDKGFSHVTRPAESAELKVFLENDLGVDELYVQNLLGVGHGV
jgi:predicted ATPase